MDELDEIYTGFSDSLWSEIVNGVDGTRICLGVDPHLNILEEWVKKLPQIFENFEGAIDEDGNVNLDDAEVAGFAAAVFSGLVLDSYDEDYVVAIKPQSAFYEQFGSKGITALESILEVARSRQIPIILDIKRGDIGSTMMGYAKAYLSPTSELRADAITISPYLGVESIRQMADYARENERGIFLLCLTSNPEACDLQLAQTKGGSSTIAKDVFDFAKEYNAQNGTTIGLVVGATVGDKAVQAGINFDEFNGPILAPGVGAQGGTASDIQKIFGEEGRQNVLPSVSRGVLNAGPDVDAMRDAAAKIAQELSDAYFEINGEGE
jgi:orotidine-5'-phosphate decarboxylase